jgi:hypothetical protein
VAQIIKIWKQKPNYDMQNQKLEHKRDETDLKYFIKNSNSIKLLMFY